MSKVFFFSTPSTGHTNPTFAVVKELVRRGEEVIYYSFDRYKDKVEKTGAIYRKYNMDILEYDKADNVGFAQLYRALMEINEKMMDNHIDDIKAEKPDYIIHDSLCSWGKYFACILGIPAISSITVFAFSKESSSVSLTTQLKILVFGFKDIIMGKAIEKRVSKRYNIQTNGFSDAFMSIERMNIIYTSKEFQPGGEFFDDSFKFVGPSIMDREEEDVVIIPESNKSPVVYISLGSIANKNPRFYEMCFRAFGEKDLFVVLSVGKYINIKELKDIPENFVVRNYVAQLEILSKADVFLTHGGMNSVHEGLYYAIPMIVVPQNEEQKNVAERVSDTEVGIYIKEITPNTLESAIHMVLNDNKYKANSSRLSESMKLAGGYKKAVDEILNFKNQNNI